MYINKKLLHITLMSLFLAGVSDTFGARQHLFSRELFKSVQVVSHGQYIDEQECREVNLQNSVETQIVARSDKLEAPPFSAAIRYIENN
jgi:hypothetical protein